MYESKQLNAYRQRAQGLVEYGFILALVAVFGAAGLLVFGPVVSSIVSTVAGIVAPPMLGS